MRDVVARPERPSRWTLPITALRVTPPSRPAIWLALKNDEAPPEATALGQPAHLLIWRQDVTPMFRELPSEEAMMWDEATRGIPFGVLCEMLATYDDPDGAAGRGAGYLHGWITAGLLTEASVGT